MSQIIHIPEDVRAISATLIKAGEDAFLVGGAVRDSLLGREVADYDFATSARPDKIQALFPHTILTGEKHGTVTVVTPERAVEVTTFRSDGAYTDGRRPDEVQFADTLLEDLSRRDFTINAMAFNLGGEIIDPFGGMGDLNDEIVRAVGNPLDRFSEDGLRSLRAVRFAAQLGFSLDSQTGGAISQSLATFRKVSQERVASELMKIMASPDPAEAVRMLFVTGLLNEILPEVAKSAGVTQNEFHEFDVFHHSLAALQALQAGSDDPVLRLAALMHDIGKPATRTEEAGDVHFYEHDHIGAEMAAARLRALKLPNVVVDKVVRLVDMHLVMYQPESWTDRTVRRFIRKAGEDLVFPLLRLYNADISAKPMEPFKAIELEARVRDLLSQAPPLAIRDLAIDGREVMKALNLSPGPQVGAVLAGLMEHVLGHPEDNTRERLLERLSN